MSAGDYPTNPNDWSKETVNRLIEQERQEDSEIEFKSRFRRDRWEGGRNEAIRKEAMAFANNNGGHIVLGVVDDDDDTADSIGNIQAFNTEENPRREISNILQKIKPQIEYAVNSFNTAGKGVVVVYIEEALRPPVTTPGEGTYYRHTENSLPMTPDQMRGMLAEFSEREAAIRQLEKELQFFFDACDRYNFKPDGTRGPFFEPLNVSGLQQTIRGQHGLWQNETAKKRIRGINARLASVKMQQNDWERSVSGSSTAPTTVSDSLFEKSETKGETSHEEMVGDLFDDVRQIWEWARDLVNECDLNVEIGNPP